MGKITKTIVFLHGALGTSLDLSVLMGLMEEKGYKALTFDFSGHGQTSKWPDMGRNG